MSFILQHSATGNYIYLFTDKLFGFQDFEVTTSKSRAKKFKSMDAAKRFKILHNLYQYKIVRA